MRAFQGRALKRAVVFSIGVALASSLASFTPSVSMAAGGGGIDLEAPDLPGISPGDPSGGDSPQDPGNSSGGGSGDGPPPSVCPSTSRYVYDEALLGSKYEPITKRSWPAYYAIRETLTYTYRYSAARPVAGEDGCGEPTITREPLPRTEPKIYLSGSCVTKRTGNLTGPLMPPNSPGGDMEPVYDNKGNLLTQYFYPYGKSGPGTPFGQDPEGNWQTCVNEIKGGKFSLPIPYYGRYAGILNTSYRDILAVSFPFQPRVYGKYAGTIVLWDYSAEKTKTDSQIKAMHSCSGTIVKPSGAWEDGAPGYYSESRCQQMAARAFCSATPDPTITVGDGSTFKNYTDVLPVRADGTFTEVKWTAPEIKTRPGISFADPKTAVEYEFPWGKSIVGTNSPSLNPLYFKQGVNSKDQPYLVTSTLNDANSISRRVTRMDLNEHLGFGGDTPQPSYPTIVEPDSNSLSRNGANVAFADASISGRWWEITPMWSIVGMLTAPKAAIGDLTWMTLGDGSAYAQPGATSVVTVPALFGCSGDSAKLSASRVASGIN